MSIRIATANFYERSLTNLRTRQSALDRAQMELATGKKILRPSDDPTGANTAIRLRKEIEVSDRYITAQTTAERFNLLSENAVATMTDVLFRTEELLLTSTNGTMDANSLGAIAEELKERLIQFEGVANTKNANGDFIFSGYQTETMTYEKDEFGYNTYQGDSGQREVLIAAGFQLKVNDPASDFIENVPSSGSSYIPTRNPANPSNSEISMGFVVKQKEFENTTPPNYTAPYTVNFLGGAAAGQVRVEVRDNGGTVVPLEPNKGAFADITPGTAIEFNGIEIKTQNSPPPQAGDTFQLEESNQTSILWTLQRAIDAMTMVDTSYRAAADAANASAATLNLGNITEPGSDHEFDDYTVNILAGGQYEVYGSDGSLVAGPMDYTAANQIKFRGIEFDIGGTPVAGDTFHIDRPISQARVELVDGLLNEVKAGLTSIDNVRSEMGARLNAVEVELNAQFRYQEITRATLADVEEIDIYEAVNNLESNKVGLQAAQQSFAKIQNLSLFNYI